MIFEISHTDIQSLCESNGMKIVKFYQAFSREAPTGSWLKKLAKRILIDILPDYFLVKIFPKPGTTGFLAIKI